MSKRNPKPGEQVIKIVDSIEGVVAVYTVTFTDVDVTPQIPGDRIRELVSWLRNAPYKYIKVRAMYPNIVAGCYDEFITFNNPRRQVMDIERNLNEHLATKKEQEPSELKTLFVAPAPSELPDDGVLSYVEVETVFDLHELPDRTVALFHPRAFEHLKCAANNTTLFGLRLLCLSGLPDAEYTPDFDSATWNLEHVAYHAMINDLRIAGEVEANLKAENVSTYEREKSQYTRQDGSVKDMTKFDIASDLGAGAAAADDSLAD